MKHEIRSGQPVEVRADEDGNITVAGYAAIFGERADIHGVFEEVIAPGAFSEAIGRDDVVFLANHTGMPLARTRSGTLELKEDEKGLYIESVLDKDDPDVQRIVPKMRRGDMDKMSFAFIADVEVWDETGDVPLRTIQQAKLRDVSIVNFPAYEGTEIGLRSVDEDRQQALQALEQHRENVKPNNQTGRRKRLMEAELAQRIA